MRLNEILLNENRRQDLEKKLLSKLESKVKKLGFTSQGNNLVHKLNTLSHYITIVVYEENDILYCTPVLKISYNEIEYLYDKTLPKEEKRSDIGPEHDYTLACTYHTIHFAMGEKTPDLIKWIYKFDSKKKLLKSLDEVINFLNEYGLKFFDRFTRMENMYDLFDRNELIAHDMMGPAFSEKRVILSTIARPDRVTKDALHLHGINIVKNDSAIKNTTSFNHLYEFEKFIHHYQKDIYKEELLLASYITFRENPFVKEIERTGEVEIEFKEKYTLVRNLKDKKFTSFVNEIVTRDLSKKKFLDINKNGEFIFTKKGVSKSIAPRFYQYEDGIRLDAIVKIYLDEISKVVDEMSQFVYKKTGLFSKYVVELSIADVAAILGKKYTYQVCSTDPKKAASEMNNLIATYAMPFFKQFSNLDQIYKIIQLEGPYEKALMENLYYRFNIQETFKREIVATTIAALKGYNNIKSIVNDWHRYVSQRYHTALLKKEETDQPEAQRLIDFEFHISYLQTFILNEVVFSNYILNKEDELVKEIQANLDYNDSPQISFRESANSIAQRTSEFDSVSTSSSSSMDFDFDDNSSSYEHSDSTDLDDIF